ncbi:hypothetical protein [Streptomyces mirabilis]|nr:hypothetical protein [Streptomyces mirabilis]MCX4430227.1 hypothetical protein [Streptomyces mirabilis]
MSVHILVLLMLTLGVGLALALFAGGIALRDGLHIRAVQPVIPLG